MALKLNIGTKSGETHTEELTDDESKPLQGMQIGDTISGDEIGFSGYKFEITGGSDNAGFPMRKDVSGTQRKRVLVTGGVGFRGDTEGERRRRTVAGNTIGRETVQVNIKVLEEGDEPLGEVESEQDKGESEEKESPEEDVEDEKEGSEDSDESEEESSEDSEEKEESSEEVTRSELENMTKDEIKEYAEEEHNVELSTDDLKDEMIDQLLEQV